METPLVSAFVVAYNTRGLLKRCLDSIIRSKGDISIEIFVRDNGSQDGTARMVRESFPDVHLKANGDNLGFARAMNQLLPLGRGQYFLIVHPDLELCEDTLSRLIAFFKERPEVGIAGGNLYYPDGTPNPCEILCPGFSNDLLCFAFRLFRKFRDGLGLQTMYNPLEWDHKSTARVNWVWNACMMARKEVFEKIGYFDERFFVWYADWDFCRRAFEAGWATHYVPSARAIHHERQSFSDPSRTRKDVRYKVDGWLSAPRQIADRHIFLRKYIGSVSVLGAKIISLLENSLRLLPVLGNIALRKSKPEEISYQLKACLETLRSIIRV